LELLRPPTAVVAVSAFAMLLARFYLPKSCRNRLLPIRLLLHPVEMDRESENEYRSGGMTNAKEAKNWCCNQRKGRANPNELRIADL
jgi:hypothetical protein